MSYEQWQWQRHSIDLHGRGAGGGGGLTSGPVASRSALALTVHGDFEREMDGHLYYLYQEVTSVWQCGRSYLLSMSIIDVFVRTNG